MFRISFNTALMFCADELRAVTMTAPGWADASNRAEPGAWASPEEALANVGAFRVSATTFIGRKTISEFDVTEMLRAAAKPAFRAADGAREDTARRSANMRSLLSSSALAVNFFDA